MTVLADQGAPPRFASGSHRGLYQARFSDGGGCLTDGAGGRGERMMEQPNKSRECAEAGEP